MGTRFAAVIAMVALSTASALAQSYPGDSGAGTQLGIAQLNGSGQVGIVTLFGRGQWSRLFIEVHGTRGRHESVRLYRGADCTSLEPVATYFLADVKNGVSRTDIGISEDRALSGNYNVVIMSNNRPGAIPAACGHLYR